ncbi:MAG: phosphate-starvation-inducible PsiE family protein [Planctomycetota bacterium]|nr:phosphate-starvation-inducible PsiE family protein [Planctomycetota bacterium]
MPGLLSAPGAPGSTPVGDLVMLFFRAVKGFERIVVMLLIVLMAIVVLGASVSIGVKVLEELTHPPVMRIDPANLMELFGMFLIVFIGIELLDSIRTYIIEKTIHVEMVLLVSIMAIARKVIVLDFKHTSDLTLLGIAAICISLTAGYFLVRKSHSESEAPNTSRFYKKPGL